MLGFSPISTDAISSITNSIDGGSVGGGGGGDDGNGSGIPIRVLIQRGKK